MEPRGHLGASDVAALFDVHPFESAYTLWLRETGQRRHESDETTHRQQIGLDLEPAILAAWGRDEGFEVDHNTYSFPHPTIAAAGATPDGLVIRTEMLGTATMRVAIATAQVKTVQPWERATYLAGVPRHHFLQVQMEMGCLDVKHGYLICQFGFNERAASPIVRDEATQRELEDKIGHFWRQVNGEAQPPEPTAHRAEIEAMMYRERERVTVDFGDERIAERMAALDDEFRAAAMDYRNAKKRKAKAQAAILNALGNAECGVFPDGSGFRIDWQERKASTTKATRFPKLTRFTGKDAEEGEGDE